MSVQAHVAAPPGSDKRISILQVCIFGDAQAELPLLAMICRGKALSTKQKRGRDVMHASCHALTATYGHVQIAGLRLFGAKARKVAQ